ncbi:MAG: DNA-binding protein WhiA [Clostridia bacterium]|nr:DNA-binding protein WhiA [Clostridia bacterium]
MADCKAQILSSIPNNNCCSHTFVNVVFVLSAQIDKEYKNLLLNANNETLNKVSKIVNNFYPNIQLNSWNNFLLISGNVFELLQTLSFSKKLNLNYYENDCDKLTILKTMFLVNGNFYYNQDNTKNSTGYSLEFVFKDEEFSNTALTLLEEYGFTLKKIKRLSNFVIYTKNSNIICDLLVKLGATYTALEVQNSLAIREIRNAANRQNNCFEFNLDKTLNASGLQMQAINYIIDNYSIDYLDENLREIALVRIANPDVSLNDLRQLLNNKISRAGIKYRLDKIIDIYKKLKGE